MLLQENISAAQAQAGFKFKLDYHRARLGPPVTSSYNPARSAADPSRGGPERNDIEEAAYRRWRQALHAMGMMISGAVLNVTCHDAMPRRQDMDILQRGLQRLVEWYRLPDEKA